MKYEIEKLISDSTMIETENGRYIGSVAMTKKALHLLNDGGKSEDESWLSYRKRTANEREEEEMKRCQLAKDIVSAYNYCFVDRNIIKCVDK